MALSTNPQQAQQESLTRLGLPANQDLNDKAAIKKAYRKIALAVHPDKNQLSTNPTEEERESYQVKATKFIDATEAYAYLLNPAEYEKKRAAASGSEAFIIPQDPVALHQFMASFDVDNFFDSLHNNQEECTYSLGINIHYMPNKGPHPLNGGFTSGFDFDFNSEQDLKPLCDKHFSGADSINILYCSGIAIPNALKDIIHNAMMQNTSLIEVKTPNDFFTPEQNVSLSRFCKSNRSVKTKSLQRDLILWSTAFSTLLGAWLGIGLAPQFLVPATLIGAAVGLGASTLHHFARKLAAQFYPDVESIQRVTDRGIKKALLGGAISNNFSHYLSSFLQQSAYRHPIAFLAGMYHALNENLEETQAISALNNEKSPAPASTNNITSNAETTSSAMIERAPKYRYQVSTSFSAINTIGSMRSTSRRSLEFSNQNSLEQSLRGDKINWITLVENPNNYVPQNFAQMLLIALKKSPYLIQVDAPNDFFNREQRDILDKILLKNKTKLDAHDKAIINASRQKSALAVGIGAAVSVGAALLVSATPFGGAVMLMWGCLGSYLIQSNYHRNAYNEYSNEKDITEATLDEIDALNDGLEAAESWPKYIGTFFKYNDLRYPQAGSAAIQHTLNQSQPEIELIKNRYKTRL